MSGRRHGVLVVLFFTATTVAYTYPLAFRPTTTFMAGLGDYITESAMLASTARQWLRDPLHATESPFYYPYSHTIVNQQSFAFTGLLAAPLLALADQPLLAANLLTLLALVASGALSYRLAYFVTGRVVPSGLAGLVFTYFSNRMDHIGQFTYQQGALMPLALLAGIRFFLGARWRDLLLLVAALWGQTLSSLYNGYALGLLLLGLAAVLALLRPRLVSRALLARSAVGVLLLAVALAPFLAPYLAAHRELGLAREIDAADLFGMDLLSILDAGVFSALWAGRLVDLDRSEGGLFPGFAALGLAAIALAGLPRGRPGGPGRRLGRGALVLAGLACAVLIVALPALAALGVPRRALRPRTLTVPLALVPALALAWIGLHADRRRAGRLAPREWTLVVAWLGLLGYSLTLAPTLYVGGQPWGSTLFRWIHAYVPGGSAFRAPGRWSLVFALPLALLVACGARTLLAAVRGRKVPIVAAALVAAVMAESVALPIPWERLPAPSPGHDWLGSQPGDFAVLEVPFDPGLANAWAMFRGTRHWKRLVNGAGGFPSEMGEEIARAWSPFDPAAFGAVLRSIEPLRYLVAHPSQMGREDAARWRAMPTAPLPGLRHVARFGDDDVYAVSSTPETGILLTRYFSTEYARDATVRYALRFDGADPEVTRRAEIALNGRLLRRVEAGGPGEVALAAPLRQADRNGLTFRHVYRVAPAVARSAPYRIGRTGAQSPVDIRVLSGGKFHGNLASILVNGHELVDTPRRGYNLAALDPVDGRPVLSGNFDTFQSEAESRRMAAAIDALPAGTLVVASVKHDGGGQLTDEGVRALESVGGRQAPVRTLWRSHLLIGVKGARPGEAVEEVGERLLAASIGRERPLTLTLEALAFR